MLLWDSYPAGVMGNEKGKYTLGDVKCSFMRRFDLDQWFRVVLKNEILFSGEETQSRN